MRRTLFFFLLIFLLPGFIMGQSYFGKNKIQYHPFDWQVLKTEHFDIYFYPEMEDLAEIGAAYAEEAYDNMQNRLNHTIPRRIPLVFYSSHFHFEETNTLSMLISEGIAGFYEHIKGRVVIPCDGSLPAFKKTIQHEIIHVFQHSFHQRVLKDHRQNIFRSLPLWFTEGQAEYWSEGWDSDAEMVMRDGILNNIFVPIDNIYAIAGSYLMYKEGQSFLRFLAQTYGEGILAELMRNAWRADHFDDFFEFTTGENLKKAGEAWQYSLQKEYYPLLEKHDLVRFKTETLTARGYHSMPALAPGDSLNIYFVANRDGYPGIYATTYNSGPRSKVKRIIRSEYQEKVESFHLQNSQIDISRDGQLAFAAKQAGRDRLNVLDVESGRLIHTVEFDSLISIYSPSWSSDCENLAFTGLDFSGRSDLYVYRPATGHLRRLTHDYYDDRDPDWSPGGHQLVFSSDRGQNGEAKSIRNLFLYGIDTGRISRLTAGDASDQQPEWSPDGSSVAFSSDRDGVPNIWLVTVPDEENAPRITQLSYFITGAFHPAWANDQKMVFAGFDQFSFQLYTMTVPHADSLDFQEQLFNEHWVIRQPPRLAGSVVRGRQAYKKRFSLDFAQSQVVQDPIYGTGGGGQFFISDLLGNEFYHCLIYNNARNSSSLVDGFNVAVTRVDQSRRLNYALGLYRLAGRYYNHYEGYFFSERIGGMASLSYPLNKFERIETSLNVRRFTKDRYTHEAPIEAFLLSNYVSYTRDNALWGATGPVDGMRFHLTLGNTVDIQNSEINFTTFIADYRRYTRLTSRISHAVRVWGQFNHGKEALPYTLGGSWDLRGYRLWSFWGPRLAFVSNEIRFPLLDLIYLRFPFGGMGFRYLQGALFVDAGNVWDDDFGDLKGSFGLGLRMRFAGYMVLRLDIGRRTDFKTVESDTFKQFFFGWDF